MLLLANRLAFVMKPKLFFYLFSFFVVAFLGSCDISKEDPGPLFPEMGTTEVSDITQNSVAVGGVFLEEGQADIIDKGFVWGLSGTFTSELTEQSVGSGTEDFDTTINGLESNTSYIIRAYAKTGRIIAYGNTVEFTTLE